MIVARGRACWRSGLLIATLGLCAGALLAATLLDARTARGETIYLHGTSADHGAIEAIVGDEGVTLPASAAPCTSCHGRDGLGREEGGLLPPDIRWSQLTKSYGHVHGNGRRHPAFDEESFARLLRTGLDPAGNELDRSMPRYRMSDEAIADLVDYLKRLEKLRDPGVSAERIQVGTLLPLRGPRGAVGQAMAQVLHGHFQDVNAQGGIYGRDLTLLTIPFAGSTEATLESLRQAIQEEGIFALVGAYTVGMDKDLLALLREDEVPLVGPFTLDPGDQVRDAAAFYLYPGFQEQARALVGQALGEPDARKAPAAIVGAEDARIDRLVAAVGDEFRLRAAPTPTTIRYRPGAMDGAALAARVREAGAEALFFFGAQGELEALIRTLGELKQYPRLYLLSAFLAQPLFEAPPAFHYRMFIAYPTLSSDFSPKGWAAYQELARRHALPRDHIQAQAAAFAAATLLVEGLRRAGRDLTRERLVAGLEALYAFDTGLTPPLTYGPNRRIGARGAHVVTVDLIKKAYEPVGGWQALQ